MKKFLIVSLCIVCLCLIAILTKTNTGRYQIVLHPTYRADQYLLDTKTGRTGLLVDGNDYLLLWEPLPTSEDLMQEENK